jgi:hypothetical protein
MKIILGKELDGEVYFPLGDRGARAGVKALGPAGFLDMLETHFGCVPKKSNPLLREIQFGNALRKLKLKENRFYTASFDLDDLSAARRLLNIRDTVLLGSDVDFSLSNVRSASSRMAVLSELERTADVSNLDHGDPERIKNLVTVINQKHAGNPVKEIRLLEEKSAWPRLWRALFNTLENKGTGFRAADTAVSAARGNLGEVQARIGDPDRIRSAPLHNDASVLHIRANNHFEAAHTAAALISALGEKGEAGRIVIIRDAKDSSLDEALHRRNLPVCGTRLSVQSDSVSQFLPLFLSMLWEPVDPYAMRQLLLLPESPLPRTLCRRLLRKLAPYPGVDTSQWKTLRLQPLRHDRGTTIPVGEVRKHCVEFREWLADQSEKKSREMYTTALEQTDLLVEILKRSTAPVYTREELNRLCARILRSCPGTVKRRRERGGVEAVSSAGAVLEKPDVLIWFNATASSAARPHQEFFTDDKGEEAAAPGFERPGLSGSAEDLTAQAEGWRRAVRLTGRKLIFISPHRKLGDDEESHPIWHEVLACFEERDRVEASLQVQATELLEHRNRMEAVLGQGAMMETGPVAESPFQQTWNFSPREYGSREYESPSSIENLLGCPFRYALDKLAAVRPDDTPTIADGPLLYGSVAHAVLESFLKKSFAGMSDDQAAGEVGRLFDGHIDNGITLLNLPGRDFDRENLRQKTVRAGRILKTILENNKLALDENDIEREFEAATPAGLITGRCDLLLHRKDDPQKKFIIDIKYSRRPRMDLLQENRAVQLAVYSKIIGSWPPAAYFILNNAELLTIHENIFKGATVIRDKAAEQEIWNVVEERMKLTKAELESGNIRVGTPGKADPDGNPFPAPCEYCKYKLFCRIEKKM